MKKKIVIVGKNSYIGSNLYFLLKNKINIKRFSYRDFINLSSRSLNDISYIINCTTNKKYINNKYSLKNDFDFHISKKIHHLKCKMIFFSSRKIYKTNDNIKENNKKNPNCNYSKNKLNTEKKLVKLMKNKVLILRLSNLIGPNKPTSSKRKLHNTFINSFFNNIKKAIMYENKQIYKDFMSVDKLSEIILKCIKNNVYGIYNVSLGEKVYLNKLVYWLNFYNKSRFKTIDIPSNFNRECFYLNNDKLKKKINIKIDLNNLEKYCKSVSKMFFKKNSI